MKEQVGRARENRAGMLGGNKETAKGMRKGEETKGGREKARVWHEGRED